MRKEGRREGRDQSTPRSAQGQEAILVAWCLPVSRVVSIGGSIKSAVSELWTDVYR